MVRRGAGTPLHRAESRYSLLFHNLSFFSSLLSKKEHEATEATRGIHYANALLFA